MSTTILTDQELSLIWARSESAQDYGKRVEQAVLQSEQVQAWKRDAERYRWATALDDNAETLYSIVLSYGGDQAKINERVDAYRPDSATKEQS